MLPAALGGTRCTIRVLLFFDHVQVFATVKRATDMRNHIAGLSRGWGRLFADHSVIWLLFGFWHGALRLASIVRLLDNSALEMAQWKEVRHRAPLFQ